MGDHILGPFGSRRRTFWRRRFIVLPVVAISALAFFIASALAVHDLDLFELDRNTADVAGGGDDWNTIDAGTDSAEVTSGIVSDNLGSGDQFQAGGSKDNNDISQWLWKPGEPLDKDDITNGYAAGYVVPEGAVEDEDLTDVGDFIIYFGLDRFANNGTAQVGFWFFRNDIAKTNIARGGGFEFSGVHAEGDILVQSNFTQGGVISSISVFKWVGSGGSHGALDLEFSAADCVGPPALAGDDPACATANRATEPAPSWDYTAKFPDPADPTGLPQGSFFEGGLNVSRLIPDAGCISTFMVETRSSAPFDSRLKDFALGDFNTCRVAVDTAASPTGGDVTPGTSVTDTATVTGSSLVGGVAPTPTGTVTFFLCQPDDVTPTDPGPPVVEGGCLGTDGDQIGDPVELDENGQATSEATTDTDAIGKYCWRAEYTPAEDSPYSAASFTNFSDECFTTVAVDTTTTTRQFVYPQDKASISAPSGGALDGSVTFQLFDNATECANGTDVKFSSGAIDISGTSPQTATTNNTTYRIIDNTTHYWKVSYDSDNPSQNDSVSACTETTAVTFAGNDLAIAIP